jgi:hypothetical protein
VRRFRALLASLVVTSGCSPALQNVVPQSAPAIAHAAPAIAHVSHSATGTGVIVPLYVYPGKQWNVVIRAKTLYPTVPIVIIANVDNGPGHSVDQNYVKFVAKAQMAGIDVVGYVYTQYGKRSATSMDADIAKWEAYYHTDGVFLDQMATNSPSYYSTATTYAHAHSLWLVIGNPGVDAPGNAGTDIINFYEKRGYPRTSFLARPAHLQSGSSRWSYIAGAVPFDAATIRKSAAYVKYLFATNGTEPERYSRLPSYFVQLVQTLSTL